MSAVRGFLKGVDDIGSVGGAAAHALWSLLCTQGRDGGYFRKVRVHSSEPSLQASVLSGL